MQGTVREYEIGEDDNTQGSNFNLAECALSHCEDMDSSHWIECKCEGIKKWTIAEYTSGGKPEYQDVMKKPDGEFSYDSQFDGFASCKEACSAYSPYAIVSGLLCRFVTTNHIHIFFFKHIVKTNKKLQYIYNTRLHACISKNVKLVFFLETVCA